MDWYAPIVDKANGQPAWSIVLADRRPSLAPELSRALAADADRQAKARGEIVGLDFDPFLNTHDACERYEVGVTTSMGQRYRVEVHAVCSGKRSEQPDVVAEVAQHGSSWVFVNFHYPTTGSDLHGALRQLEMAPGAAPITPT